MYVGFIIFIVVTYYLGSLIIKFTKFFCSVLYTASVSIYNFVVNMNHKRLDKQTEIASLVKKAVTKKEETVMTKEQYR